MEAPSQATTCANVLVIEDAATVRRLIAALLTQHRFAVAEAEDGAEALTEARRRAFDVVLLDLKLPDIDGLDLCRLLRADDNTSDAYIVIVSGRAGEADRIDGFDAGADDYLVKPFSPEELVLRIQAMLRRPRRRLGTRTPSQPEPTPEPGGVHLLTDSRCVELDGRTIELTQIEFSLLSKLMENAGSVVSRNDLIEACWGSSPTDDNHLLSVHVANLRSKIDPDGAFLRTRRGVGYVLAESALTSSTT